jgi:hypothetical protein
LFSRGKVYKQYLPEERLIVLCRPNVRRNAPLWEKMAEQVTFGRISTGALSDLEKQNKLAMEH